MTTEITPEKPWMKATPESTDWRTKLEYRGHTFYADEPIDLGGSNSAVSPGVLLMGSLASCTIITIQMYAKRKGIDVSGMEVNVRYFSETVGSSRKTRFEKRVILPDHLDAATKTRLFQVSEACPISKILNGEIETTTLE